jgi:transcriptional regulator
MSRIENDDAVIGLKMLLEGYELHEIGKKLGCTHQNVSYLLRKTVRDSLDPKSIKNQIKVERQTTTEKVLELSRQGLSQAKIAQDVGCSQTRVWRILKKFNAGQSADSSPSPKE